VQEKARQQAVGLFLALDGCNIPSKSHRSRAEIAMLNRALTFAAGFFVYVASLLCFVLVPPQVNKPQLAGGFAVAALICAAIALARKRFVGWERTLAKILIGGSLMSVAAVGAITLIRTADAVRKAMPAGQLDGFKEYRMGFTATLILLLAGGLLVLVGLRSKAQTKP